METAEPTTSRWDFEAYRYDDEPDHGLRDPVVRQAWRRVLTDFLPPPPADVLDVACGTGSLAVLLAECGYQVAGIDASRSMLGLARRKADDARVAVTLDHRTRCRVPAISVALTWCSPGTSSGCCLILRPPSDLG